MKKLVVLLMVMALSATTVACGSSDESADNSTTITDDANQADDDADSDVDTDADDDTDENEENVYINDLPTIPLDNSLPLTDSVLDGCLAIDGVVYQMPIAVSELVDNGWTYKEEDQQIDPGTIINTIAFYKDNMTFDTQIINEYDEPKNFSECHVAVMSFGPKTSGYTYDSNYDLINVQFSKNVNISTTADELIEILGESDSSSFLYWLGDNAKYVSPGHKFSAVYNDEGQFFYFTIEYLPADFEP